METIFCRFALDGEPISRERCGNGHINKTFLVTTDTGKKYIFQQINEYVFKDIAGLMENVSAITRYISDRSEAPERQLHLVPTSDGKTWLRDESGKPWRVYDFIENSLCLEAVERPEDFFNSAVAFGSFQQTMADFPAETLSETIPGFHDTVSRLAAFKKSVAADPCNRVRSVQPEVDFVLEREEKAGVLQRMKAQGKLPIRVTHNDTKLNNVMLDACTRKPICVLDLDTVMPGLALSDFGDSIRFGASTAAEDERDITRVSLDLDLYRTYTKGFIRSCPSLTDAEVELLPMGAWVATYEQCMRFLGDYIDGDKYFHCSCEDHNLVRTRTQMALCIDMENKWEDMQSILAEEVASAKAGGYRR